MNDETKWLIGYVLSSWLSNFGHGMVVTVIGPSQPYLAYNVGVSIDTINLVWTAGFLGYTVGSIVTGYVFRRFCTTNRKKMLFLWLTFFGNGAIMISLPFINNFSGLVCARCLQNIFLGAYITADTSLVVYTMGPIKSRPFTFALHSLIGVGFLAATFLVKPFLPEDEPNDNSQNSICYQNVTETIATSSHNALLGGVPKIAWPFIISGAWCMVFCSGFAILSILPFKMPVYYGTTSTT